MAHGLKLFIIGFVFEKLCQTPSHVRVQCQPISIRPINVNNPLHMCGTIWNATSLKCKMNRWDFLL
jgi:hypothetical protein